MERTRPYRSHWPASPRSCPTSQARQGSPVNQSPRRESCSPWTPRTNFSEDIRIVPCDASCDGHGLKLRLDLSGARRWLQRLVIHGKPRTLGLGGYLLVSLAEAREKAFANQADHAGGAGLVSEFTNRDTSTGRCYARRGKRPSLAFCRNRSCGSKCWSGGLLVGGNTSKQVRRDIVHRPDPFRIRLRPSVEPQPMLAYHDSPTRGIQTAVRPLAVPVCRKHNQRSPIRSPRRLLPLA